MSHPDTISGPLSDLVEAFNAQSGHFDALYGSNPIIQYKRERVRSHVLQWVQPPGAILELNAGTGEDAIFFAGKGFRVHATDISEGMMSVMGEKVKRAGLENSIGIESCSFETLDQLKNKGPFDLIFSNFAGLNCTGRLDLVLKQFDSLLKARGVVTLVVMPKFCLWESLLAFRGRFRTAFRRFFSSRGVRAQIEGRSFRCWYYAPSYITRHLLTRFDLLSIEGLCTWVPPSYLDGFVQRYPGTFRQLVKAENRWKAKWPWNRFGDYYIISLRKRG